MAIVTAECIKEVFDNGLVQGGKVIRQPRFYYRSKVGGLVSDFDTDNRFLMNQTTENGMWCFQFDGHRGYDPNHARRVKKDKDAMDAKAGIVEAAETSQPPMTAEGKPDKRFKKNAGRRSKARNAAMIASRAANKAARQERIDAEIAAETQQESTATA